MSGFGLDAGPSFWKAVGDLPSSPRSRAEDSPACRSR